MRAIASPTASTRWRTCCASAGTRRRNDATPMRPMRGNARNPPAPASNARRNRRLFEAVGEDALRSLRIGGIARARLSVLDVAGEPALIPLVVIRRQADVVPV